MKKLKRTKEDKVLILKAFEEYLNNLKDDDKVSFEYSSNSPDVKPTIVISSTAYIKMKTLISKCNGEVGWNGVVTRVDNNFYLEDILVYPQVVSGTTVTCDEIETGMWLMKQKDFNKIRYQAHSHVNMGVTPSAVDRTMFDTYKNVIKDEDYYIFMIWNKSEEFYIEIIDKKTNAIYYKNDVIIKIDGVNEWWEEVKENIQKHTTTVQTTTTTKKEETKTSYDYENCKNDCKTCDRYIDCIEHYMSRFGD